MTYGNQPMHGPANTVRHTQKMARMIRQSLSQVERACLKVEALPADRCSPQAFLAALHEFQTSVEPLASGKLMQQLNDLMTGGASP